jgi:hypothetical protein
MGGQGQARRATATSAFSQLRIVKVMRGNIAVTLALLERTQVLKELLPFRRMRFPYHSG